MSYKNQLLKGVTNGRYGKKTYLDLVKRKTNNAHHSNNKLFVNKTYPTVNEDDTQVNKFVDKIKSDYLKDVEFDIEPDVETKVQTNNIIDPMIDKIDEDTNCIVEPHTINKIEFRANIPNNKISQKNLFDKSYKDPFKVNDKMPDRILLENCDNTDNKNIEIFTEQTETKINKNNSNKSKNPNLEINQINILERKILELEKCIFDMITEIEKIKNNQKNIIDVVNKLSKEISITRNKITR